MLSCCRIAFVATLSFLLMWAGACAPSTEPGEPPAPPDEPGNPYCDALGLPSQAWNAEGPYGTDRHELAEDFSFPKQDGSSWTLSEHWTGCDAYVFIPDGRPNSGLDPTSIWARDLDALLERSPRNAHYFFVATASESSAAENLDAMAGRVAELLEGLPDEDAAHWEERLHVANGFRTTLPGWLSGMLAGQAWYYGFAVDPGQGVRILGNFADVTRYRAELSAAEEWPWEANMSHAAYEVRYYNQELLRDERLAADGATVVSAWSGDLLGEVAEVDVAFPDAAAMNDFDTLEIDLHMDCEDPAAEFGSCGPWDYLSHLYLQDAENPEVYTEMARFITTYHREGRYVVDASAMLPLLAAGGQRQIRFNISPPWNPQAYRMHLDFRFSNQGKGVRPAQTVPLWSGATFNTAYNDAMADLEVDVPVEASRVELWVLLTGHGMETYNCAEFCNHRHLFTVNGSTYEKAHPETNDQQGCISQIENGMTPNQGGTWWLGRGGWCPGQQVIPWVVDVTEDVTAGEAATLSYMAMLGGGAPPDGVGNIVLSSWLVSYE